MVELTRLGDFLVTVPALVALHNRFPGSTMTIAVDARYAPLVPAIVPFAVPLPVAKPSALLPFLRCLRTVRRRRFDLAIAMSPARRNAALVLAGRAARKVGYLASQDSLTPYLTTTQVEAVGMTLTTFEAYGREHISQRPEKILGAMGIPAGQEVPSVELPTAAGLDVRKRLAASGISAGVRFVAIHPCSGWEYRTWSARKFAELAAAIGSRSACPVVFFAPEEDWEQVERVREFLGPATQVVFLKTDTLLEAAVLIREAALFVGNDSGPLHLASLFGVPSVGLFGPAPPSLTGPINRRSRYVYRHVECSPCDQRRCIRPDNPCIELITTQEMLDAVESMFQQQPVNRG